jgi:hypothetical protein
LKSPPAFAEDSLNFLLYLFSQISQNELLETSIGIEEEAPIGTPSFCWKGTSQRYQQEKHSLGSQFKRYPPKIGPKDPSNLAKLWYNSDREL